MAATTAAFETELRALNVDQRQRGLMQGANYRLRRLYLDGMADPAAHTAAKVNPRQLKALNDNAMLASFDAITGP